MPFGGVLRRHPVSHRVGAQATDVDRATTAAWTKMQHQVLGFRVPVSGQSAKSSFFWPRGCCCSGKRETQRVNPETGSNGVALWRESGAGRGGNCVQGSTSPNARRFNRARGHGSRDSGGYRENFFFVGLATKPCEIPGTNPEGRETIARPPPLDHLVNQQPTTEFELDWDRFWNNLRCTSRGATASPSIFGHSFTLSATRGISGGGTSALNDCATRALTTRTGVECIAHIIQTLTDLDPEATLTGRRRFLT